MDLTKLNVNLLVALDIFLEERSVTRAAKRLGLSQPAASAVLKQCRDLLGDPILVRARPRMRLTPMAREMAVPLRQALEGLQAVVGGPPEFAPETADLEIFVGSSDYATYLLAPVLLPHLARIAPGVRLRFVPVPAGDCNQALLSGQVDLTIAAMPNKTEDIDWCDFITDSAVCLLRAGHPCVGRAVDGKMRLEDFRRARQVHVAIHRTTGSLISDLLPAARGLVPQYTVSSHVVAPHVIGESDLVVVGSRLIAQRFVEEGRVVMLDPPGEVNTITTRVAWHGTRTQTPWMQWLCAQIREIALGVESHPRTSMPSSRASRMAES